MLSRLPMLRRLLFGMPRLFSLFTQLKLGLFHDPPSERMPWAITTGLATLKVSAAQSIAVHHTKSELAVSMSIWTVLSAGTVGPNGPRAAGEVTHSIDRESGGEGKRGELRGRRIIKKKKKNKKYGQL